MKRVYEKEADGFKLQFFEEKNVKIKATINPPPQPLFQDRCVVHIWQLILSNLNTVVIVVLVVLPYCNFHMLLLDHSG